jgi:hypothetical protein
MEEIITILCLLGNKRQEIIGMPDLGRRDDERFRAGELTIDSKAGM